MRRLVLSIAMFFLCVAGAGAHAQTTPAQETPPQPAAVVNTPGAAIPPGDAAGPAPAGEVNPNEMMPLVFNQWEQAAIRDARAARGMVRPPSASELRSPGDPLANRPKPPPEERELNLQGIVFVSADDWAIWLNGKRFTPKALPKEALELRVYKEYVEMKWFDDYTNQIFPIRLRPHRKFNMDARLFLPG